MSNKDPYLVLTDLDRMLIEKYQDCINNTGGPKDQTVEIVFDLMGRPMVSFKINFPLATIQAMVYSQVLMLRSLNKADRLGELNNAETKEDQ